MGQFRLCYLNKGLDDGPPYTMFMDGDDGTTLDDIWNRVHNFYDFGSIVNVMDTVRWIDKTFYK